MPRWWLNGSMAARCPEVQWKEMKSTKKMLGVVVKLLAIMRQ